MVESLDAVPEITGGIVLSTMQKLWKLFDKRVKMQFAGLLVMQFIGSLLELLGVSLIIPFIEALMNPEDLLKKDWAIAISDITGIVSVNSFILLTLGGLIIVFVVKNLYLILMTYVEFQVINHNRLRMQKGLMEDFMRRPYMFHVEVNSAEIQRIVLGDASAVFTVLENVFQIIADVLTTVMLLALLLTTDWFITIIALLLLLGFLGIYFKVFKNRLYQYGVEHQYYSTEIYKSFMQSFQGIKEIKINECEQYFIDRYAFNATLENSMAKRGNFVQRIPKYMLEMICTAGILSVIFCKVLMGTEAAGLVSSLAVFAMAAYRMLPIANKFSSELVGINNNKVSVEQIFKVKYGEDEFGDIYSGKERTEDLSEDLVSTGELEDIELKDISYRYPKGERDILNEANLLIKGGSAVAFKGPSGAGKTTTADLILGILEPDRGVITYCGQDIKKLGRNWYKYLGYIPQNIYLIDDTIRKNVAFGAENPDDEKVWRALEQAQLKEFVESKPEGLDALVGEAGIKISGGQRQRIGIARALYNDPDILVLDEATSALDNDTEIAVMDAINHLKRKKTLIVIAHRLSTLEKCDEIYEIKDGKIRKTEL